MTLKTALTQAAVLAALGASSTLTDKRVITTPRSKVERGRIIPPRMVNSIPNSRVRMSKKRRIVLRDLERVNRYGFSNFTDRFESIKRRVRVAKESFLRAEPCYGLRVAAGIIDPNR